jgi:hypothetical protein
MLRRFYAGKRMAPQVGLEPTTLRLTAGCSAIELLRSVAARALMAQPVPFESHHSISMRIPESGISRFRPYLVVDLLLRRNRNVLPR